MEQSRLSWIPVAIVGVVVLIVIGILYGENQSLRRLVVDRAVERWEEDLDRLAAQEEELLATLRGELEAAFAAVESAQVINQEARDEIEGARARATDLLDILTNPGYAAVSEEETDGGE